MGSIYRPKYKRRDGAVAQSQVYWIKWYRNGRAFRESTDSDKESVAKKLLRQREGDVERGVPVTTQTNRVTLSELLDDVLTDYTVNGRRSLDTVTHYIEGHVRPTSARARRRRSRRPTCARTSPSGKRRARRMRPSTASSRR
jgi:hypothetical protein